MAHEIDVALVTEARYERDDCEPGDWYLRQILDDDRALAEGLARHGLRARRIDWARADFDWTTTRAAVLRSTWNYFVHEHEFRAWIDRVARATTLLNSAEQVVWSMDKHYLGDLAARGVRTVATRYCPRQGAPSLSEAMHVEGWSEVVVKPVVSGAALHTHRVHASEAAAFEPRFRALLAEREMMLQPFVAEILVSGELSLMVVDGRFTHAVRKVARPGDFRVQDDHGGTVVEHIATAAQREFAERAVAACDVVPLYARVDAICGDDDVPMLMELELVEPEMFFRFHRSAADRLADAIAARLRS